MTKVQELKRHLRPGRVYRREELARWSNAVDRHLRQLVGDGTLTKLAGGLYAYPRQTVFGKAPAEDGKLVAAFLKDRRFLLASPNAYNSLGVGTTQLYDQTVVYNHKRHGKHSLGGRTFDFRMKPSFPKRLSREFLLVDLVNNLNELAEDRKEILERVKERVASYDKARMLRAVRNYGNVRTRKFFSQALSAPEALGAPEAERSEHRAARRAAMKKKLDYEVGSGNVFADIGLPNPEEHLVKAQLVYKIGGLMKARRLKQVDAARLFGVKQPDVSKLLRGDFRQFSVERLLRFLVALGQDVEIVVKPHKGTRRAAQLRVMDEAAGSAG